VVAPPQGLIAQEFDPYGARQTDPATARTNGVFALSIMPRKPSNVTAAVAWDAASGTAAIHVPEIDIEAELERRNAFLQLLQVVSVAANGAPTSMVDALQTSVDEVCSQTGWTVGHVLLPSETDAGVLVSSGIWHVDNSAHLAGLRQRHDDVTFAAGVGVPGRVLTTGTAEHIADVRTLSDGDADRVRCALIDEAKMHAVAGFPIVIGDEVAGVLEFFSEDPFEADRMLLDVMAQVGIVLGRIVERSRYEAALRAAREVAEVASAAKTEFLSRMSHELRTPLTAVLGYAELLTLTALPAQERGYVAAVEKAGNHLLALINDVLDVSRLERGALRLSVEPLDIAAVIVDAIALLQPLAATYDVALRSEVAAGAEHFALCDNQALRQVMLNLIANGIKYNRKGGTVVVSVIETPAPTIRIDVADTGHGIAAADLDSIFVPFERLGAARTVEGTGLGLGISRQLVAAMGGILEVHSTVGSGTVFSMELNSCAPPLRLAVPAAKLPIADPGRGAAHTMLYVEDNIVNIELMESFFSRLRPGIKLVSTMLGELAVDLAREHAPSLILLDVNLPDIDGDEVLRRLHGDERTRAIPVVIVSADAIPSGIDRFLTAGATGYITKPISVPRLLEFVDTATGAGAASDIVGRSADAERASKSVSSL
jgi:signal transduction histidine kinase/AmiR/NasT family two-component response regulator